MNTIQNAQNTLKHFQDVLKAFYNTTTRCASVQSVLPFSRRTGLLDPSAAVRLWSLGKLADGGPEAVEEVAEGQACRAHAERVLEFVEGVFRAS